MTSHHAEYRLGKCRKNWSCVHHSHLEVLVGFRKLAIIKIYSEEELSVDYGGIEIQSVA